ncbi:MAG: zinc ribbon domain-containing protein [Phycisphaerae bacterium]|nr:zinc ribbon domain-containing protein [Phycisphaerae bacterium]
MPIHEFHCSGCDRVFEELVRNRSDQDSVTCPHCRSRKVARQVSVFAARGGPSRQSPAPVSRPGGCGRCGDPNGPCAM